MQIYIGADHAGYELKNKMSAYIEKELKHEVTDLGTFNGDTVDYPDIAREVAEKVFENPGSMGILVCGTGTGMCMVANKQKGIRAASCDNETLARAARAHNDANMLCFGQRIVGEELAKNVVKAFLETAFEGGRHQARVDKIESV